MPSRYTLALSPPVTPPSPGPPATTIHYHRIHLLLPIILAGTLIFILLLLVLLTVLLYRKLSRNRTTPSEHHLHHAHRFSYSLLSRATASFSHSNRLGHGGFGSVYKATLPSPHCQCVAVKLMDSPGSLQGEREFYNELSLASTLNCPQILSLLGFSSNRRGTKLILIYELMENGSLQDALFDRKCVELMDWKMRFEIAIDISRGLRYLHYSCEPPVIHGDIKPSNILLDSDFRAKIADFGLARLKSEDLVEVNLDGERKNEIGEDNGSILEETESVMTGYDDGVVDRSPESCTVMVLDAEAVSPETVPLSPELGIDTGSLSEGCCDKVSVDSGKDLVTDGGCRRKAGSGRDWWWKQDNAVGSDGRVKDYVMEWIGNEIKKEKPNSIRMSSPENSGLIVKLDPKKQKNRKPREWWKEEFCEELTKKKDKRKKKMKKRGLNLSFNGEMWWQKDEELGQSRRKKSKSSRTSIDWGLEGFSGELRNCRRNSHDWTNSDIPKSGGISSTPSMRGTVCYIAPEYGGGGILSEKCDIYSFGVLLLVLVSGRRPLQVTASPMSEFERANLISWARNLAYSGKLLELVDPSIQCLNKEQALLCITIALMCLQRSPDKRPSMEDIVSMLSGESEPPHLPFEFSPSPPSNFPFKSRRKVR